MPAKPTRPAPRRPARVPVQKVEGGRIVGRVVMGLVIVSVVTFAVEGGEYGTTDLVGQRRALARERAVVDSLERRVQVLTKEKKAVEADPLTQERIAREEFGMVRGDRELLYRFVDSVPPDSVRTR